jgi:hypothetical protein
MMDVGHSGAECAKEPFQSSGALDLFQRKGIVPDKVWGDEFVQYIQVSRVECPRETIDNGLVFF